MVFNVFLKCFLYTHTKKNSGFPLFSFKIFFLKQNKFWKDGSVHGSIASVVQNPHINTDGSIRY